MNKQRFRLLISTCVAAAALLTFTSRASADATMAAVFNGAPTGWYLMPGATFGSTVALSGRQQEGFVGGGELSVVCNGCLEPYTRERSPKFWLGGYIDLLHDSCRDQLRMSLGPEFGWHPIGFDFGFMVAADADPRFGATARAILGMGVAQAAARIVVLPRDELRPADAMLEFSGIFKIPVLLREVTGTP